MNRSVIAGYSNKVPALAGFKMSSSMLINTRNTGRQTIQVNSTEAIDTKYQYLAGTNSNRNSGVAPLV
jgi:hypothetical protein